MQEAAYEFPRIHLPRTWVNRGLLSHCQDRGNNAQSCLSIDEFSNYSSGLVGHLERGELARCF
jgi:hypothetical protein